MAVYCKDCKYREESNLPYPSFYCKHFNGNVELLGCDEGIPKVKTNADRVRSMTDEELAEWFLKIAACPCDAMNGGCALNDDTCRQAWFKWLKEEVKE